MLTFALTTKKIIQSTANTICIYFDVPQNFTYKAGQYITLKLIINGKEVRRPYSLSSCFGVDEELYITVKLIENGEGSRYLHNQVKVGDSIEVLKPNGQFILPETKTKQIKNHKLFFLEVLSLSNTCVYITLNSFFFLLVSTV